MTLPSYLRPLCLPSSFWGRAHPLATRIFPSALNFSFHSALPSFFIYLPITADKTAYSAEHRTFAQDRRQPRQITLKSLQNRKIPFLFFHFP
ncbi:MAG: hypothetical protein J6B02_05360 [Selenomonadales bacterium]|nr:hypothetical protein [Selenomonadales bacterium]